MCSSFTTLLSTCLCSAVGLLSLSWLYKSNEIITAAGRSLRPFVISTGSWSACSRISPDRLLNSVARLVFISISPLIANLANLAKLVNKKITVEKKYFTFIRGAVTTAFIVLVATVAIPHAESVMPVSGGRITSIPGWRNDPFGSGKLAYHRGYDIAAPLGTPVRPTQEGVISFAGKYKGYGNLVAVDHGTGYVTIYGHLEKVTVAQGVKVGLGSIIGLVGSTGRSTGPHLHYEIRQWPWARQGTSAPPVDRSAVPTNDDMWIDDVLGVAVATPKNEVLRDNDIVRGM